MTTSPTTSPAATAAATGARVRNPKSELKVEDFINMMVTQLQAQDPMEPAKNDQLLAQMSQIGQLQSSQQLQASMKTLVLQNNLGSAGQLIGKQVEGLDATTGEASAGVVASVRVEDGGVVLELDSGKRLELARVTSITTPKGE